MTDQQRLDELEQIVRGLSREVVRLTRDLQVLRARLDEQRTSAGGGASVTSPAAPRTPPVPRATFPAPPAPAFRDASLHASAPAAASTAAAPEPASWHGLGLETLIGRYGALALAALAILLGVGAFLSWAVEHIRLGPGVRVLLGAMAAVAVAAFGLVLRERDARRFGNILLGLALAIAHVVAWGAGPFLHVVPPGIAFAGAVAASAALAVLAWREDEQSLFTVGAGGALLAPFVTAGGGAALLQLLGFGVVVIGAGLLAVRDRDWRIAARILMAGAALYVGAGLDVLAAGIPVERAAPAAFALLCAWLAITLVDAALRVPVARAMVALAIVALLAVGWSREGALLPELVLGAVLSAITTYALLQRPGSASTAALAAAAIVLPMGALAAGLTALADAASPRGAGVAALWTVMAALVARLQGAPLRDAHLLVAALAGATGVVLGLETRPDVAVIALGAWGLALAIAERFVRSRGLVVGMVLVVAAASAWAVVVLVEREPYRYTPFLTTASAAAAVAVAGWWALAWVRRPDDGTAGTADGPSLVLLAAALTVGWGYLELAHAFAPDVATFLIILYLATVGITAIVLGRARGSSAARHAGLALAILAGVKALLQASTLDFGLRLSSYLIVGAFLMGVAYLYRAASDLEGRVDPAPP